MRKWLEYKEGWTHVVGAEVPPHKVIVITLKFCFYLIYSLIDNLTHMLTSTAVIKIETFFKEGFPLHVRNVFLATNLCKYPIMTFVYSFCACLVPLFRPNLHFPAKSWIQVCCPFCRLIPCWIEKYNKKFNCKIFRFWYKSQNIFTDWRGKKLWPLGKKCKCLGKKSKRGKRKKDKIA